MGILSKLFKPGPKEQERKKQATERKLREQEEYRKSYERGRLTSVRRRGYRAGQLATRPLSEKISSAFGDVGKGMGAIEDVFGFSPPKSKQRRKRKRR